MKDSTKTIARQSLVRELNRLQERLYVHKDNVAAYWKNSTVTTQEGRDMFRYLNYWKGATRKTKARMSKIRAALKDLK